MRLVEIPAAERCPDADFRESERAGDGQKDERGDPDTL